MFEVTFKPRTIEKAATRGKKPKRQNYYVGLALYLYFSLEK